MQATLFLTRYRPMQRGSFSGILLYLQRTISRPISRSISTVSVAFNGIDIETFRRTAFVPETPLLIQGCNELTALRKWFQHDENKASLSFCDHFSQHHASIFPYELVREGLPNASDNWAQFYDWLCSQGDDLLAQHLVKITSDAEKSTSEERTSFHQFFAPLALLLKAAEYNKLQENITRRVKQLYIAQSQLDNLPEPLKADLRVPDVVRFAGKGDVYDSSIWLGLEPTYTPLHRDPNPNIFFQIVSAKAVRLLPPGTGQQLYSQVQQELGSNGNSRFRGAEMMEGRERAAMYKAVWGSELTENIQEAVLTPRDSLFIPRGWWHSIRSVFDDGRLNASVNWWFR